MTATLTAYLQQLREGTGLRGGGVSPPAPLPKPPEPLQVNLFGGKKQTHNFVGAFVYLVEFICRGSGGFGRGAVVVCPIWRGGLLQ